MSRRRFPSQYTRFSSTKRVGNYLPKDTERRIARSFTKFDLADPYYLSAKSLSDRLEAPMKYNKDIGFRNKSYVFKTNSRRTQVTV